MYGRVSGIKEAVGTKTPAPEDPEDSEGEQGKAQRKAQSKTDAQLNYAGFWKRFAAGFIDFFISIIASIAFSIIVGIIVAEITHDGHAAAGFLLISIFIFMILIQWIYYAAYESSSRQATPGKTALGIQVTDLNGRRIGFGKATGRYFGKILSSIALIGFIMIAFTEKKQGLHDEMAGCLVVNK